MNKQFEKLVGLLKELFQLDQPDLDFGLYRIMHAKADEISQFLDKDLLPQVQEAFSHYQTADKAELEKELSELVASIKKADMDPDASPKVTELRQKIADDSVDVAALENEVYDHLFSFFRRYYHEGDFLAKRVYKPGVYAIPYEGEEVKLHWANRDQYYIKTSEYLRDYAFTLRPGDENDPMRVHFRLVDAAEGEHGNVKALDGNDRVFILADGDFIVEEDNELVILFHYRPATMSDWPEEGLAEATVAAKKKPPIQRVLLADAIKRVLGVDTPDLQRWISELSKNHVKVDGETADHSRLEGHLNRYTKRFEFDYFIHKDLGGFLRRELDFFIKNEVMHLDDIESESAPRVEQYLSKIKVVRNIAHKLIDFLAQLEDFQKTLWLKKKFVIESNYCITLDRIPKDFYAEIAGNDAQRQEWVELFGIDSIERDLQTPGYSDPLTVEFLESQPGLLVDTRFFDETFVQRLIETIHDFDQNIDGLLVHSENFQALRLLSDRYEGLVGCIYIDPPYNSPSSEIAYKNNYKHSSWLTLMNDRIECATRLSSPSASCVVAIDENEQNGLERIMMEALPDHAITSVAIEHNKKGVQGSFFSYTNEFAVFAIPPALKSLNRTQLPEEEWEYANLRNWGGESLRTDGRNCFYAVKVKNGKIIGFGDVCDDEFHPLASNVEVDDGIVEIYPIDAEGTERKWRYARDTVEEIKGLLKVDTARNGDLQIMKAKADSQFKTMWYDPRYNAGDYGTKVLTNMGFEKGLFDFPKSVHTVKDCVYAVSGPDAIVLDYFAGSGTTAESVIALNREDGGHRKYILVEMGSYFDAVTKPRVLKAIYSEKWSNGKPQHTGEPLSHTLKYIRLETYEDSLNNLKVERTAQQSDLLNGGNNAEPNSVAEEYRLRYMLDVETRGSQSLLNIADFSDPSNYKLNVKRPGSDESHEVSVDLVETFNYLIGLNISHIQATQRFKATFERDDEGRLRTQGRLRHDDNGPWWFRAITGVIPDGRRALVIWRKLNGDQEQDNLVLDEWFTRAEYSTQDYEFDVIYVNGDNNLENLRQAEDAWKVRLIEFEFLQRMFG